MKVTHYLYADFETTHIRKPDNFKNYKQYYLKDPNAIAPQVYSWVLLYDGELGNLSANPNFDINLAEGYNFNYGISIDTFIKTIETLNSDTIIYFNNLRSFDGHYIVPALDRLGYNYVPPFDTYDLNELPEHVQQKIIERAQRVKARILKDKKIAKAYHGRQAQEWEPAPENLRVTADEWLAGQIKKNWSYLFEREYSLVVVKGNKIYEIKIGLESEKSNKNRVAIIRDNMNIFPSSIKAMGETLAKQAKILGEPNAEVRFHKQNISYLRETPYKSLDEFRKDEKEYKYVAQDAFILWKFHKMIAEKFPRKDWKLTVGATSYAEWVRVFGQQLAQAFIADGRAQLVTLARGAQRYEYNGKKYDFTKFHKFLISELLPCAWLDNPASETDSTLAHAHIYRWYSGGLVKVNEDFRGQFVENVTIIDRHSSYPSVMTSDIMVPIGAGYIGDVKTLPFKLMTIQIRNKITNKNGLPFLDAEGSADTEYKRTLLVGENYLMNSNSYQRFLKYYKPNPEDYSLVINWSFAQMPIKSIFGAFVEKWYKIRLQADAEGDLVTKFIAKLFLNSLYGKFGTKSEREFSVWDAEKQLWITLSERIKSKYYLPMALTITTEAMGALVDGVGDQYHNFIYCDTDSLALLNYSPEKFPNLKLHKTALNTWGIENTNMYGLYRRSKQYILYDKANPKNKKIVYSSINWNRFLMTDDEQLIADDIMVEFDKIKLIDFIHGKKIEKQLHPFKLPAAGMLLEEINRTIPQLYSWKTKKGKVEYPYPVLYEQKFYHYGHFSGTINKVNELEQTKK